MIVACLCICKFQEHHKNQAIYKSVKFQKYFLVRGLLVSFRNRPQDFSEYSITF